MGCHDGETKFDRSRVAFDSYARGDEYTVKRYEGAARRAKRAYERLHRPLSIDRVKISHFAKKAVLTRDATARAVLAHQMPRRR